MSPVSIQRETRNMLVGRITAVILSVVSFVLFPRMLGPVAHGWYQYYSSLSLFLLGFLNGCVAPMAAHYVPLYRVSEPHRQGILLKQTLRWYLVLLVGIASVRFVLKDPTGFGWIYLTVAASGLSQLVSSAIYGLGRLGPITWFPVLSRALQIFLICGTALWYSVGKGSGLSENWAMTGIPFLLFLSALPSLFWMGECFVGHYHEWFPETGESRHEIGESKFPWKELRDFGVAAVAGQILYQAFTRALPVLAMQWGYPQEQVGYLGLGTQVFGQVVFLAGIFSVGVYPWLVSSNQEGDLERFRELQAEAWRLCVVTGCGLVSFIVAVVRPLVWVFLGEKYHADMELLVFIIRVGAIAGGIMLIGEFHLRLLVSQTKMKRYLIALVLGFFWAVPYLGWARLENRSIQFLAGTLIIGVLGLGVMSILLAPRTRGFFRSVILGVLGGGLAILATVPIQGLEMGSFLMQSGALCLTYGVWCWVTGLINKKDLEKFLSRTKPPTPGVISG